MAQAVAASANLDWRRAAARDLVEPALARRPRAAHVKPAQAGRTR
jgi:hypothetical protein